MPHTTTPVDWTTESGYWRSSFSSRPYFRTGRDFEYYEPAYRYGFESADRYRDRSWDNIQADLERGWDKYTLRGKLAWAEIKDAVRDAWDRAKARA